MEPLQEVQGEMGRLKSNPFSVESMRSALDHLKEQNLYSSFPTKTIQISGATSYYVRFTPRTEEEFYTLEADFGIEIFDEPLDSDFLDESYVEPPLPSAESSHYYTTVDIDYPFDNGVPYQILYAAYLPLEDELLVQQFLDDRGPISEANDGVEDDDLSCELLAYVYDLESQSLIDNGYGHLVEPFDCGIDNTGGTGTTGGTTITYPTDKYGRITADDDVLGIVPIEGVKVTTARFLSVKSSYTDRNGYYLKQSDHRGKRTRYKLKFERRDFLIRQRNWKMAKVKGPKQTGLWNYHMPIDTKENFWSTIFRATYHYYHLDNAGLRRPPQKGFLKRQLKIKASWGIAEGNTHQPWRGSLGIGSDIKIFEDVNTRNTLQIYSTTIHELAHASNWNFDNGYFWAEDRISESWARGVEWVLTRMIYPNYLGREWTGNHYTPIVADMIDASVPRGGIRTNWGFTDSRDMVQGYTISQIEETLNNVRSWDEWRTRIFNSYNNVTENNLEALFNEYR